MSVSGFHHFETKTFGNDSTAAVGVSPPLVPACTLTGNSELLLPELHSAVPESSQGIQEWKWAWGIMGCQSNGFGIKKTQMNPQKNNSPVRGLRFHETEPPQINTSSFPPFPLQLCVPQSSGSQDAPSLPCSQVQ